MHLSENSVMPTGNRDATCQAALFRIKNVGILYQAAESSAANGAMCLNDSEG